MNLKRQEPAKEQWGWSKRTTLLLRVATFFLLAATLAIANAVLAAWRQENPSLILVAILTVLFFTFMTMGLVSRRRDRLAWQRARDAEASRVMEAVRRDASQPFALYLRSFDWTGVLPIQNPDYRPDEDPLAELATLDLEEIFTRGISPLMPVIALGLQGEAIGAGRYTTDDSSWQADVEALGKQAVFVLMLPLFSAGTLWEMGFLRQAGLLHKTIVVMPPAVGPFTLALRERWRAAQAKLAETGIALPDYLPAGGLFIFDARGNRILKRAAFPKNPAGVMPTLSALLKAGEENQTGAA